VGAWQADEIPATAGFSSLIMQPWMAAPTKQARQRLMRREQVRTCAGRATRDLLEGCIPATC
jgi:hypothetical protein